jgi:predicted GIY-YIG superfamily endonuclease
MGTPRHRWGRSQKYHARPRQLYALLFENGCAYIGQSIDVKERERQHRRPAGGWCGKPFQCVLLGVVHGTEEQAKHHEHAWRHVAHKRGWTIYAKPPAMVVNHRRQMSLYRYLLAWTLRWPREHNRNRTWQVVKTVVACTAVGAACMALL